jgi:hypothetical protein
VAFLKQDEEQAAEEVVAFENDIQGCLPPISRH